MSAPLRGALIGCGYVARFHLRAWAKIPTARIVAICDVDPSRLTQAAVLAPNASLSTDAGSLLAAEQPDFVEICTRPEAHRPLVELAARHGTHVLCQKPIADNRDDLLAMITACDQANVRFMVHENWRFRPWYRALKREIASGVIGEPIRLRLAHRDTRALRPDGFQDQPYFATMPRLLLFEMGCHLVDTARYLMGEVRSVFAMLGRFGPGHPGDDTATLSLRFASGALGLLDLSWCAPAILARPEWALNETVVEGTEGALRLRGDGHLDRLDLQGRAEPRRVPLPPADEVYEDGYRATQAHFVEGLRGGFEHETSGRDSLRTMDVIWAGYRSAEQQRAIELPSE
jgi:predicted dehydrogenase